MDVVNPEAGTTAETVTVFLFNTPRGDFDGVQAKRRGTDVYELLEVAPSGDGDIGDLVRCELSDGELVVQERLYRKRLI